MTKICYIMVGVSGSGKSTVVNKLKAELEDVRVFSLDDVRLNMYVMLNENVPQDLQEQYARAFDFVNDNQQEFNKYVDNTWSAALKHKNVIVDNTNLTRKSRARWIQDARRKGFTIIAVNVMAPLSVVLQRQATRGDKSVPMDVVRDMYFRQQEVQSDEADFIMHYDGVRGGNLSGRICFA